MEVKRIGKLCEVECKRCHSVLALDPGDLHEDDSGHGAPYYCKCAICGHYVDIQREQIPPIWVEKDLVR